MIQTNRYDEECDNILGVCAELNNIIESHLFKIFNHTFVKELPADCEFIIHDTRHKLTKKYVYIEQYHLQDESNSIKSWKYRLSRIINCFNPNYNSIRPYTYKIKCTPELPYMTIEIAFLFEEKEIGIYNIQKESR